MADKSENAGFTRQEATEYIGKKVEALSSFGGVDRVRVRKGTQGVVKKISGTDETGFALCIVWELNNLSRSYNWYNKNDFGVKIRVLS